MCNDCCKESAGWCRSFTKLERALTILEALLLAVLLVTLILLILHLIVCSPDDITDFPTPGATSEHHVTTVPVDISSTPFDEGETAKPSNDSTSQPTTNSDFETSSEIWHWTPTSKPGVKCSWTPSAKTTAGVHYFEDGATAHHSAESQEIEKFNITAPIFVYTDEQYDFKNQNASLIGTEEELTSRNDDYDSTSPKTASKTAEVNVLGKYPPAPIIPEGDFLQSDRSDGEEADIEDKSHVVALVKLKPPRDVVFGCILTIVTEYWTLTAASCIEAIEEVDSLDSFVIMEQYDYNIKGPLQSISDVHIHPFYEGNNRSYDLAALKSEGSLTGSGYAVGLPSILDYALIPFGERFTILGYGALRSIDKGPSGRSLRRAHVYKVPERQCAAGDAGALRHLAPGRRVAPARCGDAPVCAAVLAARALPCNYCSGTPLLRGRLLLGVMSDNQQCGVACEPQLYVNVAVVRDWIDSIVRQ